MEHNDQLNSELLAACIEEKPDLARIEQLLQQGARPLGAVKDSYGMQGLVYSEVVFHYVFEDREEFVEITKLFLGYGMDVEKPDIPYDDGNIVNPVETFALSSGDCSVAVLKLLLDAGISVTSAEEYICRVLFNWCNQDGQLEAADDYEALYIALKEILLIASYPYILENYEELRKLIWLSENQGDPKQFRQWENYRYEVDTSHCRRGYPEAWRSIVTVFDKQSGEKVWRFGIEIAPDEVLQTN